MDQDDIVDLESLTVLRDGGTLQGIREVPFGSLAAPDRTKGEWDGDSEDEEEGEGSDDDELGDWEDDQHTAKVLNTPQPQRRPMTEEDKRDLEEFLRAERQRQIQEDNLRSGSGRLAQDRENEGPEEDASYQEPTSDDETSQYFDEEESRSESSFRPTPTTQQHTSVESSEDELADTVTRNDKLLSMSQKGSIVKGSQFKAAVYRQGSDQKEDVEDEKYSAVHTATQFKGNNSFIKRGSGRDEDGNSSSDDDLAHSDGQTEMETRFIRAYTVEPSFSPRCSSPVKAASPIKNFNRAISASPVKRSHTSTLMNIPSTSASARNRAASVSHAKSTSLIFPSQRDYKQRHGNPQLNTPPRSKSSVFSVSDEVFRASSIPSHQTSVLTQSSLSRSTVQPAKDSSAILRPSVARKAPKPTKVLGKRRRAESPDGEPTQIMVGRQKNKPLRVWNEDEKEDSGSESPDPLDSVLDEEKTSSNRAYRSHSFGQEMSRSRSSSPVPSHWQTSREREIKQKRDESMQPPDLSQLLFHLRKVNEWVRTHHINVDAGDIGFEEVDEETDVPPSSKPPSILSSGDSSIWTSTSKDPPIPPHLLPRPKSMTPTKPRSRTLRKAVEPANLVTPQKYQSTRSTSSSLSRSHSLVESVTSSTRSVRSSLSTAMGPPPTPTRLFASSPLKFSSARHTPSPASLSSNRGALASTHRTKDRTHWTEDSRTSTPIRNRGGATRGH